jgi:hypothetical protein
MFLCSVLFFGFALQARASEATYRNLPANYRLSLYGGPFLPSGSYEEPGYSEFKYKSGFTSGIDFTYFLNENIGLGGFLEFNSFSTEEKIAGGDSLNLSVLSVILGISGTMRANLYKNFWFFSGVRAGYSLNSLEGEGYRGGIVPINEDTSGTALAFSLQEGVICMINSWDIGLLFRYTVIEQGVRGASKTDLGGASLLVTVGYNF